MTCFVPLYRFTKMLIGMNWNLYELDVPPLDVLGQEFFLYYSFYWVFRILILKNRGINPTHIFPLILIQERSIFLSIFLRMYPFHWLWTSRNWIWSFWTAIFRRSYPFPWLWASRSWISKLRTAIHIGFIVKKRRSRFLTYFQRNIPTIPIKINLFARFLYWVPETSSSPIWDGL